MTFGVIVFMGFGCCGGVYLLLPGEEWQTHNSAAGGFSVELPAKPQSNMQLPDQQPGENMKVEGTMLWKRVEEYVVIYADIPPARIRGASADTILDEAVRGMETQGEVRRVVRQENIKVSGFPGREIEFVGKDGGTYLSRVIVADSKLYVLVAGGRFTRPGNASIRRFMNSFKITDAKLVQPAKW